MAFTQQARFSFEIVDYLGVEGALQLYALIDPTKAISALYADLNSLATIIDNLVSGQVVSSTLTIYGSLSGLKSVPITNESFSQTGLFNFLPTAGPPHYGQAVPSLVNSVISGGTINPSAAAVVAFVNWVLLSNTDFQAADQHFRTLEGGTLSEASLSFRKRPRQLSLNSFTPG